MNKFNKYLKLGIFSVCLFAVTPLTPIHALAEDTPFVVSSNQNTQSHLTGTYIGYNAIPDVEAIITILDGNRLNYKELSGHSPESNRDLTLQYTIKNGILMIDGEVYYQELTIGANRDLYYEDVAEEGPYLVDFYKISSEPLEIQTLGSKFLPGTYTLNFEGGSGGATLVIEETSVIGQYRGTFDGSYYDSSGGVEENIKMREGNMNGLSFFTLDGEEWSGMMP